MVICVDFDGTCVTHEFPKVGKEIGAAPVLRKLVADGHKIVLFTMRSHRKKGVCKENLGWDHGENIQLETDVLDDAIAWFEKHEIPLYGINENPDQKNWTDSPKAYGDIYIDDSAFGVPLCFKSELSKRPYVDWHQVGSYINSFIEMKTMI